MKQVIVMRKDLNMRKGKMVAQGAHASMSAVIQHLNHEYVKAWLDGSFTKIVVGVDSEEEMLSLAEKANSQGLITAIITDNGATEFNGVKTKTCLAIGPAPYEMFVDLTSGYKLL